jgi:GNAT superfamily N-acetyltransferase
MKIRLANSGDIGPLCILYQKFCEYNAKQQPDYFQAVEESGKYPERVISGSSGDIYVAETVDGIVGFIHVEEEKTAPYPPIVPHKFSYIVDLYVEPEYRKFGVGKELLESVKEWVKSRSLEYLELLVLEENLIGRIRA